MNQAFRLSTVLLLLAAAQLLLGITAFNESYIFENPGILDAKASNLSEWLTVAKDHPGALYAAIAPFDSITGQFEMTSAVLFCAPVLGVIFLPDSKKFQITIPVVLTLLLAIDVNNLLSFNGFNSANGGYDGLDDIVCYGLHQLVGAACIALIAWRWMWMGGGTLRRYWAALDRQ